MPNGPAAPAARKARTKIDPNETKSERFRRLGEKRVSMAIKTIGLVGNLTGSQYESTPEQREKIRDTLVKSVQGTIHRLEGADEKDEAFTL